MTLRNRLIAYLLGLLTAIPPAVADDNLYLIFDKQPKRGDQSTQMWIGPEPQPGVNIPEKARAVVFVPVDGDTDPHHYIYQNGGMIRYIPDQRLPDPVSFLAAFDDDPELPLVGAEPYLKLLTKHAAYTERAKRYAMWQRILNAAPAWLTPSVRNKIVSTAKDCLMPVEDDPN